MTVSTACFFQTPEVNGVTCDSQVHNFMKPTYVLLDFLVTVKVAPHECVIRTGQL